MQVNDKLHALRGQHWRQGNNTPAQYVSLSRHSLPKDLFETASQSTTTSVGTTTTTPTSDVSWSGPKPPKSWTPSPIGPPPIDYESPAWRAKALVLLFSSLRSVDSTHKDIVPSLSSLCLQRIVQTHSSEDLNYILTILPYPLCQMITRFCAIYKPSYLASSAGYTTQEVYMVGPGPLLAQMSRHSTSNRSQQSIDHWDTDEDAGEETLYSVAVLNTNIPSSIALPITITHLALIHVTGPLRLHHLFSSIVQVVFIDLSYNDWLASAEMTDAILGRVAWKSMVRLKTLGVRKCTLHPNIRKKINERRWTEVNIIEADDGDDTYSSTALDGIFV